MTSDHLAITSPAIARWVPRLRRLAATGALLLPFLFSGTAQAQRPNSTAHWVGTWGAAPSSPANNSLQSFGAYNGNNTFNNQTVRFIVRTSIAGNAVRIRLSNAFGTANMIVGAAHVAIRDSAANIVAGTDQPLTFGGFSNVTILPAGTAMSDPVILPVPAGTDLAVSLYIPGTAVTIDTSHAFAFATSYVSPANGGDATGAVTFPLDATQPTTTQNQLLTAVEVYVPTAASAVVTFGDSITEGFRSTVDANRRWPDFLARRLAAANQPVGVVNMGISGNKVLVDNAGPSGQARFERDFQITGNAKFATVLLGINDINNTTAPGTAADIIAGHRQFIARARSTGQKIYGCTLTPAGFAASDAKEVVRAAVNNFIRNSGEYDAVIDFDAVTRDPANPTFFLPAYDSGDHLHPNDAGYEAMGNAVPLSLFQ